MVIRPISRRSVVIGKAPHLAVSSVLNVESSGPARLSTNESSARGLRLEATIPSSFGGNPGGGWCLVSWLGGSETGCFLVPTIEVFFAPNGCSLAVAKDTCCFVFVFVFEPALASRGTNPSTAEAAFLPKPPKPSKFAEAALVGELKTPEDTLLSTTTGAFLSKTPALTCLFASLIALAFSKFAAVIKSVSAFLFPVPSVSFFVVVVVGLGSRESAKETPNASAADRCVAQQNISRSSRRYTFRCSASIR